MRVQRMASLDAGEESWTVAAEAARRGEISVVLATASACCESTINRKLAAQRPAVARALSLTGNLDRRPGGCSDRGVRSSA
jgi:hypothetical protein